MMPAPRPRALPIVADAEPSRLANLVRRRGVVTGDREDFVHFDWSAEWTT